MSINWSVFSSQNKLRLLFAERHCFHLLWSVLRILTLLLRVQWLLLRVFNVFTFFKTSSLLSSQCIKPLDTYFILTWVFLCLFTLSHFAFLSLSLLQINSEKRAAAEMMKPKPKPQKKKKKKDPNEPQKPVSAYALFFRDTQAAIKGQNPNATFGDVSKIVASMWDSLGEEQKQVQNMPKQSRSGNKRGTTTYIRVTVTFWSHQ